VPIVLQKSPSGLHEVEICNYRIGAPVLLNRCCAFQPDLESIFLAEMLKILLQHNLPQADLSNRSKAAPYSITSSARASSVGGTSRPTCRRLDTSVRSTGHCPGHAGARAIFNDELLTQPLRQHCPTSRAVMSVAPAGPTGTTKRTGRVG
jgi:hypothetical protein